MKLFWDLFAIGSKSQTTFFCSSDAFFFTIKSAELAFNGFHEIPQYFDIPGNSGQASAEFTDSVLFLYYEETSTPKSYDDFYLRTAVTNLDMDCF